MSNLQPNYSPNRYRSLICCCWSSNFRSFVKDNHAWPYNRKCNYVDQIWLEMAHWQVSTGVGTSLCWTSSMLSRKSILTQSIETCMRYMVSRGGGGGGGGGGTPSLRVSRYAPQFCPPPPFSASGRSFCPPKFDHVYYFIQILLGPISKPHIFSM